MVEINMVFKRLDTFCLDCNRWRVCAYNHKTIQAYFDEGWIDKNCDSPPLVIEMEK